MPRTARLGEPLCSVSSHHEPPRTLRVIPASPAPWESCHVTARSCRCNCATPENHVALTPLRIGFLGSWLPLRSILSWNGVMATDVVTATKRIKIVGRKKRKKEISRPRKFRIIFIPDLPPLPRLAEDGERPQILGFPIFCRFFFSFSSPKLSYFYFCLVFINVCLFFAFFYCARAFVP